jgi:hypothetical protein
VALCGRPASLPQDVGSLDDRPPLLDFGLLKSTKCLWSLLVGRRNVDAEIGQPSAHGRLGHRTLGSSIEFGDDVPVCPCCGDERLRKIGEDVTETLELIPRQWKVIAHVREKFSCRACEAITQAPAPRLPSPWPVALWQWAQFSVQTASPAVMTLGVTSRAATSAAVKPRLIAVASSPNSPKTCSRFSGRHGSATARLSDGATGPTGLCALRA